MAETMLQDGRNRFRSGRLNTLQRPAAFCQKWLFMMAVSMLMMFVLLSEGIALTLTVEYDTPTCAKPVTFRLSADGTEQSTYAMVNYSLYNQDTGAAELVVDPSLGSYKVSFTAQKEYTLTFFASGKYYLKFEVLDQGVTPIQRASRWVIFDISEEDYPATEVIADRIAAECMQTCDTDFEKALWLHDWLVRHSDYDYSFSYCSATAALTGHKGTCEAYHRAYEMLLRRVGVDSSRVTGNGHVWTNVRIDGKWYQVDVTWDDMGDAYNDTFYEHLYFGLTDELMASAHNEHSPDPDRPSTSLEGNYFIHTGAVTAWTSILLQQLSEQTEAERRVAFTAYMAPSTKDIVYPICAYAMTGDTSTGVTVEAADYDKSNACIVCRVATLPPTAAIVLPAETKRVEAGAFSGSGIRSVEIPKGAEVIGSGAFSACAELEWIRIPASVTEIAADAFSGSGNITIYCTENSCAHAYAVNNSIPFILEEELCDFEKP